MNAPYLCTILLFLCELGLPRDKLHAEIDASNRIITTRGNVDSYLTKTWAPIIRGIFVGLNFLADLDWSCKVYLRRDPRTRQHIE